MNILNDDCFNVLSTIEDESIDLILSDPPYGTTRCKWDTDIDLELMWKHFNRIIKPNGAIVLTAQTPFDKTLGVSNIKNLRYEWIWEKTQPTGHLNAKRMPMKAHENVLVFYKKLPTYNPQKTYGHKRKVSTAHHKRNTSTGDIYGKSDNFSDYDSTERYPRSVIKFASDKQKLNIHSTQKPVALMEYLVKTYSNENDLVLDPFAGSGTTGVACENLNREYLLIEKDIDIFQKCKDRLDGKFNI